MGLQLYEKGHQYYKIFKNTYLEKQQWAPASENQRQIFGMNVSYF